MAIQNIKANKTASLTDLRDPMKVIKAAGDEVVAIMDRNKCVAYLIPASIMPDNINQNYGQITRKELHEAIDERLRELVR